MRIFYLSEPFDGALGYDWQHKRLSGSARQAAEPHTRLHLHSTRDRDLREALYFASPYEWTMLACLFVEEKRSQSLHLLSAASTEKLLAGSGMPLNLGPLPESGEPAALLTDRLDALRRPDSDTLRIGVINISHLAFGDTILSLTFLRELHRQLTEACPRVELVLFQRAYIPDTERLYARCGFVHAIRDLPAPLSELIACDGYLDLSVPRREHRELPWIDTRFKGVGLDPAAIPAYRKRNQVSLDPQAVCDVAPAVTAARAGGRPLLLFHGQASTGIRSLPAEHTAPLIDALLDDTNHTIVTLAPVAYRHPRVLDWSTQSRSFDHFIALIAAVDAFVSVDTSLYHIADAFDVPGVVIFTSNLPEQWITYYPFITGVALQRGNRLLGTHDSADPDDVSFARALWQQLDVRQVRAALDAAIQSRAAANSRSRHPGHTSPAAAADCSSRSTSSY